VFERFVFYPEGAPRPDGLIDGDLDFPSWYLHPVPRADAILQPRVIGTDEYGEREIVEDESLTRVGVRTALAHEKQQAHSAR
jgi:hypothetical protein